MSYKVDFDALDTMYYTINTNAGKWMESLKEVYGKAQELSTSDYFTGQGAEQVKTYLSAIHESVITMLVQIIATHADNCLLYKRDYQDNIDASIHALIQEEEILEIRRQLSAHQESVGTVDYHMKNALTNVSDIFYTNYTGTEDAENAYEEMKRSLTRLDEDIINLENRHMNGDFEAVEALMAQLKAFLQEHLLKDRHYKSTFYPQSLAESETFQKLALAYEKVSAEYKGKTEVRERAYANEQIRIETLQKEYEERQRQTNWINWIVAGICIVGSIAVIACTGGAATPLVVAGVSGASGFIMSGTQNITSQYVQTGDWSKTDWLSVGKEAIIGGAEGFVTGYIGAGAGTAVTNALGKTATLAPLLNSTSTVTRVASHAAIGSISQIGAGVTTRFAGSMLISGFDIQKSTKAAFDLQGILMDGAIGGIFGGVQGGLTKPQAFTSSQVQKLNGAGEGVGVAVENGKPTVIYGSEDIAKYQYNMVENPGPLAEIQGNPAQNFYGGRYNVEVLTEDRIYYRGGNSDNALGQWFTTEPPKSITKVRIDTSVKPQWIDPITGELTGESIVDTVYAIKIPKGTTVYTGPVGPQGGVYCGGYNMMQTFIKEPWKLDYQVISKSPLN